MIRPEQIPQSAWLAMRDQMREGIRNEATLIAAALNAWPGASHEQDQLGGNWHRLILPRRGAEMQWRPIEEAPKDGTMVLMRDDADDEELETIYFAMMGIWTHGKWHFPGSGGWQPSPWFVPLRWMPLPPPPAGETE